MHRNRVLQLLVSDAKEISYQKLLRVPCVDGLGQLHHLVLSWCIFFYLSITPPSYLNLDSSPALKDTTACALTNPVDLPNLIVQCSSPYTLV